MRSRLVGNTHLVAGNAATIPAVLELLQKEGIETAGNADVYVREYKNFGIDEARELRERASSRGMAGSRRIFIVTTSGMTNEAQNALLKTLEEPPADAMFFFIVPSPESLLPTLRSRTQTLTVDIPGIYNGEIEAKKFVAAPPAKRLEMLKPLLEKGDDDKRDIAAILGFLASLERELAKYPQSLHAVYRARKYIGDKGALVKPLLEQVALLV